MNSQTVDLLTNKMVAISLTSMYLEMLYIYQRDVLLNREGNLRFTFKEKSRDADEMVQVAEADRRRELQW